MAEEASDAARELAKRGAAKGGRARASILTPEERREIARRAVEARWAKAGKRKIDSAEAEEEAGPPDPDPVVARSIPRLPASMYRGHLKIGEVEVEAHVLDDLRRVLTQREVVRLLTGGRDSSNIQRYLRRHPLIDESFLDERIVRFKVPGRRQPASGYEGTVLIELCNSYLEARRLGLLKPGQEGLAESAEIFIRASAKVGIIALIDEATGYQEVREKRALQLKLQAFIADEMQEWARMFPEEFWLELARLEGIHYRPRHRPLRWGKYVMLFVYDAIDPDVGRALRELNPDPHFLKNHHQWLKKYGRDRVRDQILQVVTIMKLCHNMKDFQRSFERVFHNSPLQLDFGDLDMSV